MVFIYNYVLLNYTVYKNYKLYCHNNYTVYKNKQYNLCSDKKKFYLLFLYAVS